jgi:regulator of RNase E activity RraA
MWSPKRQEGPAKAIGPAYTVRYVRKNYENEPKPSGHYVRHHNLHAFKTLIREQIDSIPQGAVVFISAPPRMINACYGGLMSNRAKYLGAVGTVIDGRLRDLQEHRDLEFPVGSSNLCFGLIRD